jgi:large conductance mechanosensitive channel
MSLVNDFKAFALRGNVVDMAVGIIIGGAFGTIVKSLVEDVVMPPIGLLVGNMDFSDQFAVLREGAAASGPYASLAAAKEAGAVTLNYGSFVTNVVSFLIVAFAVFLLVRAVVRLQHPKPEVVADTRVCPHCLSSIPLKATRCAHCTSQLGAA